MTQYNALTEAKIIADIFRRCKAGFRVSPVQPFRETPAFTLFKLDKRASEDIKRLDGLRANIQTAIHEHRHRTGLIGDLERTTVRINLQPLQLEVNRPHPGGLAYNAAKMQTQPHEAFCGLYYGMTANTPVLWRPDEPTQPHAWIAGTSGSGKTTLSIALLASLCAATPPAELQIFINDFKGSKLLRALTHLPHVAGMATEPDSALCAIRDFYREIIRRKQRGVEDGPRCILYIDELASYSLHPSREYRRETTELLGECARLGREYQMHLVVCTQKPTTDVIDSQIAANIPFRMVGMVTSPEQSKYATGIASVGAHLLPGRGAFVAVNGGQITRFQSPLLDDVAAEVRRIRALWGGAGRATTIVAPQVAQVVAPQSAPEQDAAIIRPAWESGASQAEMIRVLTGDPAANTGGHNRRRVLAALNVLERTTTTKQAEQPTRVSAFSFRGSSSVLKPL